MESMNKFKVLTIVVICLFVFVIAAIYTNTKEASIKKEKQNSAKQETVAETKTVEYADEEFAGVVKNLDTLNRKVDELTDRINNSEASENVAKCKILGTLTDDGVQETSPNDAIQDAKDNSVPLVVTCRIK